MTYKERKGNFDNSGKKDWLIPYYAYRERKKGIVPKLNTLEIAWNFSSLIKSISKKNKPAL